MKKLLTLLLITVVSTTVMAVPAKRGQWRTLTLADGTTVRAELRGDEFSHFYLSADGQAFTKVYGTEVFAPACLSDIEQRAYAKRSAANAQRASAQSRRKAGNRDIQQLNTNPTGIKPNGNFTGEKHALVILVNYKDIKFRAGNSADYVSRFLNEVGYNDRNGFEGSAHDYFTHCSLGQFDLRFDVVGPVELSNKRSYYGENDYTGDDKRAELMVGEACRAVDDIVDFSLYSWNDDGYVDQVFIFYAGQGEADSSIDDTVWPHEWYLSSSSIADPLVLDGVTIDNYACAPELQTNYGMATINGIGTFCHEFSHCLGLPDVYDTQGGGYGMQEWDLMDYGAYCNRGFLPTTFNTLEQMLCGWYQPEVLTTSGDYTLGSWFNTNESYIIINDAHPTEFYLLENRTNDGFDQGLEYTGLLITHIDYNEKIWHDNSVNSSYSRQRCTPFRASNNSSSYTSITGDAYPYGNNNELTNTSKPKASLYNPNSTGQKLMNKPITNIRKLSDETISFHFENNDPSALDAIIMMPQNASMTTNILHDLSGRQVNSSHARSGAYIYNGKKTIISR